MCMVGFCEANNGVVFLFVLLLFPMARTRVVLRPHFFVSEPTVYLIEQSEVPKMTLEPEIFVVP